MRLTGDTSTEGHRRDGMAGGAESSELIGLDLAEDRGGETGEAAGCKRVRHFVRSRVGWDVG